jgi:hypothetical protein
MTDWMKEFMKKCQEVEFLGNKIDQITKERNMYRTQAMMRMNKIKELEDNERKILKESYDPSS